MVEVDWRVRGQSDVGVEGYVERACRAESILRVRLSRLIFYGEAEHPSVHLHDAGGEVYGPVGMSS